MEVIYIDELFALNLIIDYLTVLASARVCGVRLRRWRYWIAALFGALYAAGSVVPGMDFLTVPTAKIACGVIMALIAFAGETALIKCTLAFFGVSAAFGGAVWASSLLTGERSADFVYLPVSMKSLVISFALCYAAVSIVFRRTLQKSQRKLMTVAASLGQRRAVFRALRDTGNELYDPVTGSEVLVASPKAVSPLLPPGCGEILKCTDPVSVLERLGQVPELSNRVRLIPYSAVGVGSGLLPVFRPDSLMVDGKIRDGVLIAAAPALDNGGDYDAVL